MRHMEWRTWIVRVLIGLRMPRAAPTQRMGGRGSVDREGVSAVVERALPHAVAAMKAHIAHPGVQVQPLRSS